MKIIKQRVDEFVASAKAQRDNKNRNFLMENIGKEIGANLMPLMKTMADNTRLNKEDFVELTTYLKSELAKIEIPMPNIVMPEIPTPIVNYTPPAIKIPDIKMPDEMNVKGWVSLMGVSLEKPLPVQMRNPDGSPVDWANLTAMGSGGGGGGRSGGNVKVTGFDASAFYQMGIINGDGRLMVETNDSSSAGTTIVNQVSGAIWSVNVAQQDVSQLVNQVSGANWSVTATATDLDIRDLNVTQDEVLVHQVSGSGWSVSATQVTSPWVVSATDLDVRDLNVTQDELLVHQVSGSSWSVSLSTALSDATDTIGTQQVSGAIDSSQVKLIARQTNPTAASDAASTFASSDDLGRTLTRPIQVRDLIYTAYVSVTSGTETTLIGAVAGSYLDCIAIMGSNNSDAAVSVDIRAVTAGNIVNTIRIPANGTAGWVPAVPWPQDATGNNWTVDGPDETGRTLTFSALFSREI